MSKKETFEHLGEDLSRKTVGEVILEADEIAERLDEQGVEDGQRALDCLLAPNVPMPDIGLDDK